MNWYSKQPPIYIFFGDRWIRETDGVLFWMTKYGFRSDEEMICYTKKNIICKAKDD